MRTVTLLFLSSIVLGVPFAFARPVWTEGYDRTVDGGDIIFMGESQGDTPETAEFSAQQSAIKQIVQECGIAHRRIVPREHYVERYLHGKFIAFARASIDFPSCEEAQQAKTPEARKRLESPEYSKNQKLYDDLLREQATGKKEDIKKMQQRLEDFMKDEESIRRIELGEMQNKLQIMKIQMRQTQEHKKREPATNPESTKCWAEFQELNDLVQSEADDRRNIALAPHFNEMERKRTQCQRLRKGRP